MPRAESPLYVPSFIQLERCLAPDVAPTGKARIYFSKSTGKAYLSLNGGAYAEIATPLSSLLMPNSALAAPKIVAYQETVAFGQFAGGGGAAGTYDLQTSIPAGSVFLRSLATEIVGFANDSSCVLTIGDGTDVDRYNTGTPSIFTTAAKGVDLGVPSGTLWHTAAVTPKLTATSATDWGAVNAGSVKVTLFYYYAG